MLIEVEQAIEKGEIVDVYLFHNLLKSGPPTNPFNKRLLPLDHAWQSKIARDAVADEEPGRGDRGPYTGASGLCPRLHLCSLFQACAESLAAENASRLAAMQRAEKSIDDMLVDLNQKFHRMRQESIDEELFDVISGHELSWTRKSSQSYEG